LVALVAGGAWLWTSGRFVQTRELDWQVGEDRSSIRAVEIQIWTERGELLKREEFFFPDGPPAEIIQKVPLSDGDYLVRVFVKRGAEGRSETYAQALHVRARAIALGLRRSGDAR
jgi:hypothetical protein